MAPLTNVEGEGRYRVVTFAGGRKPRGASPRQPPHAPRPVTLLILSLSISIILLLLQGAAGGLDWRFTLAGLAVGFLVGLTGMGGGALMTPLLILLGVQPLVAVGSDLVTATLTKAFGSGQHFWQRTLDLRVVSSLALGSLPAAVAAVLLLNLVKGGHGTAADELVRSTLVGVLLLVGAVTLLTSAAGRYSRRLNGLKNAVASGNAKGSRPKLILIGSVAGFFVGLTSVGSGSIITAFLLLMTPMLASRIVGTDILHATILSGAAGALHFAVGHVDFHLVALTLSGSLPGVVAGSVLVRRIPDRPAKAVLALMVLFSALAMLLALA